MNDAINLGDMNDEQAASHIVTLRRLYLHVLAGGRLNASDRKKTEGAQTAEEIYTQVRTLENKHGDIEYLAGYLRASPWNVEWLL